MICKECTTAGQLVSVARNRLVTDEVLFIETIGQTWTVPTKEAVRSVAHLYHGLCKGCDCQHKIDFEGKTIQSDA